MLQQAHLHGRIAAAAAVAVAPAASAPAASAAVALAPVALAPAAAVALAPAAAVALAASIAGPDLLRDLCRDCDNLQLVYKLHHQWGYDGHVLANRLRVQVPPVRGSRVPAGGALPFTITASCFHGPHSHKLHERR